MVRITSRYNYYVNMRNTHEYREILNCQRIAKKHNKNLAIASLKRIEKNRLLKHNLMGVPVSK